MTRKRSREQELLPTDKSKPITLPGHNGAHGQENGIGHGDKGKQPPQKRARRWGKGNKKGPRLAVGQPEKNAGVVERVSKDTESFNGSKGPVSKLEMTRERGKKWKKRKEGVGAATKSEGKHADDGRHETHKESRVRVSENGKEGGGAVTESEGKHHADDGRREALKESKARVSENGVAPAALHGISSNWLNLQTALISSGGSTKRPKKSNESGSNLEDRPSFRKGPPQPDAHTIAVQAAGTSGSIDRDLRPINANTSLTKVVAMDCEMVGVGTDGRRSILARVCMVNASGNILLDKHVRPLEKVVDYRTHVSGVSAKHLKDNRAEDFWAVQKEVSDILQNRILVGHALHNDLKALLLSHPKRDIRDTQRYKPLRKARGMASLKSLAERVLGVQIQEGQHDPVLDARAALYIYLQHRKEWERELAERWKGGKVDVPEGSIGAKATKSS